MGCCPMLLAMKAGASDLLAGRPADRARARIAGWICTALANLHPGYRFTFANGVWTATPRGCDEPIRAARTADLTLALRG